MLILILFLSILSVMYMASNYLNKEDEGTFHMKE